MGDYVEYAGPIDIWTVAHFFGGFMWALFIWEIVGITGDFGIQLILVSFLVFEAVEHALIKGLAESGGLEDVVNIIIDVVIGMAGAVVYLYTQGVILWP